jgi:hypothetical protein
MLVSSEYFRIYWLAFGLLEVNLSRRDYLPLLTLIVDPPLLRRDPAIYTLSHGSRTIPAFHDPASRLPWHPRLPFRPLTVPLN